MTTPAEPQKPLAASSNIQTTITPIDGSAVATRQLPSDAQVDACIQKATDAFKPWRSTPLKQRIAIIEKMLVAFEAEKQDIAEEVTREMGRPIKFSAGEVGGFLERARYMVSVAEKSLADVSLADTDKPGFKRFLRKEPLGVCFIISPWNFPYLTQVNSIVPALLAGNTIILKPSPQTPSSSERIVRLLEASGLPSGVAQVVHLNLEQLDRVVADKRVKFVSFTGSVANGVRVENAARGKAGLGFKRVNLELGGKDAAYVLPDVNLPLVADSLIDGGFFNSGQSCCAIERIYVHEKVYDQFVEEAAKVLSTYKLGDPRDPSTTIGPVISVNSANTIRKHYADAVSKGAKPLLEESLFPAAKEGTAYVNPQIFVNVNHDMLVMNEETFGPVVGIQKVSGDEEALKLINDSQYGLTCSIWTNDEEKFAKLLPEVEAGTVFLNRCDYLDPALAWTGVKDSGRGVSLSTFGYDALTQLKSVHQKKL